MKVEKKVFVFVVCGAQEHIDTIHFSLKALKRFSDYEIIVVTDSSRNEIPIEHDHIIDISTPNELDHHQASIFLKTGLYKFLPSSYTYCYLDTDVIALSPSVNDIFSQKSGVITFAPDHSRMRMFSPYAVECGCLDRNEAEWKELDSLLLRFDKKSRVVSPLMAERQELLRKKFEFIKKDIFSFAQLATKYLLPSSTFQLDEDTFYNKQWRYWHNASGDVILYEYPANVIEQIESHSQWRWNRLKRRWISPTGKDIHILECDHLKEKIKSTFGIGINSRNWQHWNGGVFLFDQTSHKFMESWHEKTMRIFDLEGWKTRDQGTLIATAWEFGLQDKETLSKHFNFIADFSNPQLMLSSDGRFISDDAFSTKYAPAFIHIFHQFGLRSWKVWNWVEHILGEGTGNSNENRSSSNNR